MKNPNNSDVPVGQTWSLILRIKHLDYYFQITIISPWSLTLCSSWCRFGSLEPLPGTASCLICDQGLELFCGLSKLSEDGTGGNKDPGNEL